ncbi:NAD(+)/NADH kinase [Desulfovulcanus sp.]
MRNHFKDIAIVTKAGNGKAATLASQIEAWLAAKDIKSWTLDNQVHSTIIDVGSLKPDLIFVLGGDGTILSVARKITCSDVPFLGVNLGQVGFLAEISPLNWQEELEAILDGRYRISERLILSFKIIRQGKVIKEGQAINDLVIHRGGLARLVRLDMTLGRQKIKNIRADGLIFATPTGSTAYSVSAGGPLVHPGLDAFIVTPICPFLQNFRPLVLPGYEKAQVSIQDQSAEVMLTVDGQAGYSLNFGDVVELKKSEKSFKLISPEALDFVQKLVQRKFLNRG